MRTIHVAASLSLALGLSAAALPAAAEEPSAAPVPAAAEEPSAAAPVPPTAEDPYDAAMAASTAAERRGDLSAAAAPLEAIAADYPQDYALPLRAAWLYYRAGRFAWAAGAYSTALSRSPGAADARAGLGWSLARLGRCDEARAHFLTLIAADPESKTASEGLAFCAPAPEEPEGPSFRGTARGALSLSLFPGDSYRSSSAAATASIDLWHRSGVFFGATYRYRRFFTQDSSGVGPWDQNEVFARVGYATGMFGIEAQYAAILDGSGTQGTSHHAGLSLRWSPLGDIVLDLAASHYDDMDVFRIAPSWKIPIAGGLSIRPGVALQVADGKAFGSGSATLALDRPQFGLFFGGKYGDEVRPAYMSLGVVDNSTEKVRWGLWAGGSVNVSQAVRIDLTYSTERLQESDGREENTHVVTLGITGRF